MTHRTISDYRSRRRILHQWWGMDQCTMNRHQRTNHPSPTYQLRSKFYSNKHDPHYRRSIRCIYEYHRSGSSHRCCSSCRSSDSYQDRHDCDGYQSYHRCRRSPKYHLLHLFRCCHDSSRQFQCELSRICGTHGFYELLGQNHRRNQKRSYRSMDVPDFSYIGSDDGCTSQCRSNCEQLHLRS